MKQLSRSTKLKLNTIMGLIYQIVTIVCGLILPRLILKAYGSDVNGLVNSISSILNVITLMELGVGAVVQSALYKPLADNDEERVNKIVNEAKKFFNIVGLIFVVFVLAVCLFYPFYVSGQFEIFSTILLILAISLNLFGQYFFGIVNNLLLQADQKSFIPFIINTITLIISTLSCVLLIHFNCPIQLVKFASSLIFLARPLTFFIYVKKTYNIYKVKLEGTELPQKWDGIVQHVAAYVLDNTDILVLTIFASLASVSVYSTYYLIAQALRSLIVSLTSGIQSYYGNIYATGDMGFLKKEFNKFNFSLCFISSTLFSIAIITIVPFVLVYTSGVTDANYDQLAFGILLLVGQFFYCTRRSFNMMILAVGHYKETKWSAIIEALINIAISIPFVIFFDLIGVAIGTAVAMLYRTIYFAWYCKKNIIERPFGLFIKDFISNCLIIGVSIGVAVYVHQKVVIANFWQWIILGFIAAGIMVFVSTMISLIFNFSNFKSFVIKIKNKVFSR